MHVDLVVVGSPTDKHVDAVLRPLKSAGVTTHCLDQIALWRQTITFDPGAGRLKVGRQTITSCSLIWNRRAYPTAIRYMSRGEQAFARSEFSHALFGALWALCGTWLDAPDAVARASYKAAQLHWATRDPRLRVPPALITSNSTSAKTFTRGKGARHVIKALYRAIIETPSTAHFMYTSLVDADIRRRWTRIKHSPCIIQEYVARQYDVRLNVIGDRVFATKLDASHIAATAADVRRVNDYKDIRYTALDVPAPIARACRDMSAHFGLRFGAFDFAVDGDGVWHFLELNPNGQWYWLEEMTGQPLAAAFAAEILRQIGGGSVSRKRTAPVDNKEARNFP